MTSLPQEDVRDYPRPPLIEPAGVSVRILLAGQIVAETDAALRICETFHAPTYYLPRAAFEANLRRTAGSSFCEWKGAAEYWDVVAGATIAPRAAWSYPTPNARFAGLKDHVAVYASAMEACFVGEDRVVPQPGDFYGGWVTANLTGPIKGAPGTRHW